MDLELELVIVPVTDVDRARHFFAETLGFHVDVDQPVGDPGEPVLRAAANATA